MHHVRGLVRHAGRRALRTLEAPPSTLTADSCVRPAQLMDVTGATQRVALLHAGALLKLVGDMPATEALRTVAHVASMLDTPVLAASAAHSTATAPESRDGDACLYVRDEVHVACSELRCRNRRFIAKVRGRLRSSDAAAVDASLQQWLQRRPGDFSDADVAEYNGMVEALVATDATAAIALAINPSLPRLSANASTALAALVQLHTPAAVHAFLESFASKDEAAASAADTCATQLAVRLRRETSQAAAVASDTLTMRPSPPLDALLHEATHFCVDPGVVFPTEPAAIQRWADRFLRPDMLPVSRAAALLELVRRRRLQPRRVMVDSLSVWTLTDLERPWFKDALESPAEGVAPADAASSSTAYQLALKDARRNLVDNRLLHTYAAALARGDVSPLDDSFAAFLEECGEVHTTGAAAAQSELPTSLCFTLSRVPDGVPLLRALLDLAPQCSFWRTLLDHRAAECAQATTAPMGEVHITVQLPTTHECVAAAASGAVPTPSLPVLYEDADVLVVDKPAGLATSRHGLSCTQLGAPTTDLISALLASDRGAAMGRVFRHGQVHRLDTETSGCVLVAKTEVAADSLRHQMGTSAAFSHQGKIYHALCVVLEPSLRHVRLHDDIVDAADPKVRTRYRVIGFFAKDRVAWVECRIEQGKKHQIRRHLASRGLPILADVVHGGAACCQSMMDRVALHAHSLSFIHPVTAEPTVVVAPLPEDFRRCLDMLRCNDAADNAAAALGVTPVTTH
ncbi:RNA pseudouridylate synthase [Novymonas esmeraldas]|uniref:RNA pseudouridylate synthase n=1 Tax=Novymonas esmeraldas TaxID=1808958 RepID=A0AAW0F424_9TRYP